MELHKIKPKCNSVLLNDGISLKNHNKIANSSES